MTPAQLRALIHSDSVAKQMADRGDDLGCATRCTAIATPMRTETVLTERGLYDRLGAAMAESILQKLSMYQGMYGQIVQRVLGWMKPGEGGFDFAEPEFLGLIDQIRQDGMALSDPEYQALINLSLTTHQITASEVSEAWSQYRPDGKVHS